VDGGVGMLTVVRNKGLEISVIREC
jgi:hypothetical protein